MSSPVNPPFLPTKAGLSVLVHPLAVALLLLLSVCACLASWYGAQQEAFPDGMFNYQEPPPGPRSLWEKGVVITPTSPKIDDTVWMQERETFGIPMPADVRLIRRWGMVSDPVDPKGVTMDLSVGGEVFARLLHDGSCVFIEEKEETKYSPRSHLCVSLDHVDKVFRRVP